MIGANRIGLEIKHFGCCCQMHVTFIGERLEQALVAGQVRHYPEFDLRVIFGQ